MDGPVAGGADSYACATCAWIESTETAPYGDSGGVVEGLVEPTAQGAADIITAAAAGDAPAGSEPRKIGDYYGAFMDEGKIEALGLAPLKRELAAIAAIADHAALSAALGAALRTDVDMFNDTRLHTDRPFGLWVAQDLDDPHRYAPFL